VKGFLYLRKFRALIFIIASWYLSLAAQVSENNGEKPSNNDTLAPKNINSNLANYTIKNPVISGSLSFIVPGAGQIYTGNYVKSGFIIAFEVGLGLVANYQHTVDNDLDKIANSARDSFMLYQNNLKFDTIKTQTTKADSIVDTTFVGVGKRMQYDYARFQEKETRLLVYQCLTWAAGVYYFNLMDAVRNTGYFNDNRPRSPSTAGWLSAIPGLALGQIYNGSLDKAGLIFMTQWNLAYMIYNYITLMRICESNLLLLNDPASRENKESKDPNLSGLKDSWNAKYNDAFRNRNMYLWYSLGLWLYGIADAVVDAHLHDSGTKTRLEPDLIPDRKQVGLNLKVEF
jgi:hypothetical protein